MGLGQSMVLLGGAINTTHFHRLDQLDCPKMYILIIEIKFKLMSASSMLITSVIDSQMRVMLPSSLQLVISFDISFGMPELGQMLLIVPSHSNCLLFDPHHPET